MRVSKRRIAGKWVKGCVVYVRFIDYLVRLLATLCVQFLSPADDDDDNDEKLK